MIGGSGSAAPAAARRAADRTSRGGWSRRSSPRRAPSSCPTCAATATAASRPTARCHVNYSKRAMALDQVEVMKHFGFDKFPVIGQDRGGRVAHRLALDHPDKVTHAAVLDIVPTLLPLHARRHPVRPGVLPLVQLPARRRPAPENELKAPTTRSRRGRRPRFSSNTCARRRDPANIHAMCEDYRAGASIDLKHDEADLHEEDRLPAARAVGREGRDGPDLRRDGDLERARHEGHRPRAARRAQPAGGRARHGARGDSGADQEPEP